MKKEAKTTLMILSSIIVILVLVFLTPSMVLAGFFDKFKATITGRDTQTVIVNITVGLPEIKNVYNNSMNPDPPDGLNSGPVSTGIVINFSVFLAAGVANMDNSTANINLSFQDGSESRTNSSCEQVQSDGSNNANYSCNVTFFWYDINGAWFINASISDTIGNSGSNSTTNFTVGQTTGSSISGLSFPGLSPGQTNKSSAIGLLVNNTGNNAIAANATQLNLTNLRGETTETLAIWADNISVSWDLTSDEACDSSGGAGTAANNMSNTTLVNVSTANLTKGNFSLNDNATGQERYYFCIKTVGDELTSQSYSTASKGAWQYFIQLSPLIFIRKRRKKSKRNPKNKQPFKSINKFINNLSVEVT